MEEEKKEDVTSLRYCTKYRIGNEMIKGVRSNAKIPEAAYFIVVDYWSLKMLSSVIKLNDLVVFNIAGFEKLDLKRKKFPLSDVIYFITPTINSVERLIKDFKDKPQYGYVHLCFTNQIPDALMNDISSATKLSSRIKSVFETNLDFYVFENNYYHFGVPPSLTFYKPDVGYELDKYLEGHAKKLFSICNVFSEFPYIQYSSRHSNTQAIATKLSRDLKRFYTANDKIAFKAEKRATILILDRIFDLSTPLCHETAYQSMVYDLLDINKEDGTIVLDDKLKAKLDEEDELWMRTKTMHIAEANDVVRGEFSAFVSQNQISKGIQNGTNSLENLEIGEMANIVKNAPKNQELYKKYAVHLELLARCVKIFQEKDLKNVIDIEQSIISGVDVSGKEVGAGTLTSSIARLTNDHNLSEDDLLRVILLFFVNYHVPEKSKDSLVKLIKDDHKRQAIRNLVYLTANDTHEVKNLSRRYPKMTKVEVEEYLIRDKASKFGIARKTSVLKDLVHKAHHKSLSLDEYPFIEQPIDYEPEQIPAKPIYTSKRANKPNWNNKNADVGDGIAAKIIVFVLGGLSYQEIAMVDSLRKEGINVVAGGSCLMDGRRMATMIEGLHRDKLLLAEEHEIRTLNSIDVDLNHQKTVKKKKPWWRCGF